MPHGIHTERILADPAHFSNTKAALDTFFVEVMLPILLTGRREPAVDNDSATNSTQLQQAASDLSSKTYCWCNSDDIGRMVACDNPNCPREWFHFQCVGLTRKPRGR